MFWKTGTEAYATSPLLLHLYFAGWINIFFQNYFFTGSLAYTRGVRLDITFYNANFAFKVRKHD